VSGRTVQRTRSNAWQSSVAASSAAAFSVSTNDPSASVVSAPGATLVIRFGGRHGVPFTPLKPSTPTKSPAPIPGPVPTEPAVFDAPPERKDLHPPGAHTIELIIDSLPHHELTEPIPVTIDPLGDAVFTASMRYVDVSATGHSIGEALVLLKEQIAHTYDDLNRRLSQLNYEQKTALQMLHTYIAPQSSKPPEAGSAAGWKQ
jgi:hypothetical protein